MFYILGLLAICWMIWDAWKQYDRHKGPRL
jgi:hypothetical protein